MLAVIFTACNNSTSSEAPNPRDDSKKLNDMAMNMQMSAKDSNDLLGALYYLDQAIQIDSSNIMAYTNKINLLLQLKKEDKALATIQLLNKQKEIPEFVMFEGFLLDKKADTATAHEKYSQALKLYDQQFQDTKDSMMLLNKGFAILMLNGKDSGVNYYESLPAGLKNHPLYEDMMEQATAFDKQKFLLGLW